MAIEVSSDQWTGEAADDLTVHPRVFGEFPDRGTLERAVAQLEATGGFQRQDMTHGRATGVTDNSGQVAPPDEHPLQADARNLRQLGTGMGMAVTAMGAAGVVIATGGAALPAVAAAAAAGATSAAAGTAIGKSAEPDSDGNAEGTTQHPAGVDDNLALGVRVETEDKRVKAEEIFRACGAVRVWHVAA